LPVKGVRSISVIEVGLLIVFSAEGRFASETKMTTLEDESYIVDYDLRVLASFAEVGCIA